MSKKKDELNAGDNIVTKKDLEKILKNYEMKTILKLGKMAAGEQNPDFKGQIKYIESFLKMRKAIDDVKRSEKVLKLEIGEKTRQFLETVLSEMEEVVDE